MILVVLALVAIAALAVAALERIDGRGVAAEYRQYLADQGAAAAHRITQLELMLDGIRTQQLELPTPEERDNHLLVSAPSIAPRGRRAEAPIHSLELSIDALPELLKREVRAIEGEEIQREYLETIQRELAGGATPQSIADRLFHE